MNIIEKGKAITVVAARLRREYSERGGMIADFDCSEEEQRQWCAFLRPWRAEEGFMVSGMTREEVLEIEPDATPVFLGTNTPPRWELPPRRAQEPADRTFVYRRPPRAGREKDRQL